MPLKDPSERKAYQKRYHANWYSQNSDRIKNKSRITNVEAISRNRAFIREYKESNPCVDCDGFFHFSAMDFDHITEEKKLAVSRLAGQSYSIETLLKEMSLCELVCSNCHRVRTWQRLQAHVTE